MYKKARYIYIYFSSHKGVKKESAIKIFLKNIYI